MGSWTSKIEPLAHPYRKKASYMETKKNKYDTNPLDPEVGRRSEEVWGEGSPSDDRAQTQPVKGVTREVADMAKENTRGNVYSEAPTKRYDNPPEAPYPSVFIPPQYSPPAQYPPTGQPYQSPVSAYPTSRSVLGINLPEKWAVMLPYTPLYIGLVMSLVELFLVPRKEVKVRFHASQALALHITILMVQTVFGVISTITDSSFGGVMFKIAALIFLIVSMRRVWKGETHRIAPLGEPAQWFNEHIEPRTKG
jgi:uncharacterized membrane protein